MRDESLEERWGNREGASLSGADDLRQGGRRFEIPKSFIPADFSCGQGRKSEALGEALEIQLPKPLAPKERAEGGD